MMLFKKRINDKNTTLKGEFAQNHIKSFQDNPQTSLSTVFIISNNKHVNLIISFFLICFDRK